MATDSDKHSSLLQYGIKYGRKQVSLDRFLVIQLICETCFKLKQIPFSYKLATAVKTMGMFKICWKV